METSTKGLHKITLSLLIVSLILMLFEDFLPTKRPYSKFENNTGRRDGRTQTLVEMRSRILKEKRGVTDIAISWELGHLTFTGGGGGSWGWNRSLEISDTVGDYVVVGFKRFFA